MLTKTFCAGIELLEHMPCLGAKLRVQLFEVRIGELARIVLERDIANLLQERFLLGQQCEPRIVGELSARISGNVLG